MRFHLRSKLSAAAARCLEACLVPDTAASSVGQNNEAVRHRWVEDKLQALPASWRILDAGAGEQRYRSCCTHLSYVSQDFAQYRPGETADGLHQPWEYGSLDHVCDIAAVPEPDNSFDAVLCTEVFEHLSDPLPALREFARLLRPGGLLLLTAPFCSLTHMAPHHFSTGFSRFYYEKHLRDNGFEVVEITPNGNYFEYLAQELRRLPLIAERYADDQLGRWAQVAQRLLLEALERFSSGDHGSAELLCFGYHVCARRAS